MRSLATEQMTNAPLNEDDITRVWGCDHKAPPFPVVLFQLELILLTATAAQPRVSMRADQLASLAA